MPMPSSKNKKQRIGCTDDETAVEASPCFTSLSTDRSRRLCKKTINAAKDTVVPLGKSNIYHDYFQLDSIEKYNALIVMAEVLPGLRHISINRHSYGFKYNDGENPDEEEVASTADYITLRSTQNGMH